ncbi:MAG: hypothetical protein LZF60_50126 [Nitrospira sp.]|nr:MAG: hypothetical protein LZF60_50126 [Nitrospira sp.]
MESAWSQVIDNHADVSPRMERLALLDSLPELNRVAKCEERNPG